MALYRLWLIIAPLHRVPVFGFTRWNRHDKPGGQPIATVHGGANHPHEGLQSDRCFVAETHLIAALSLA